MWDTEDLAQYRRCIRYIKRWRDVQFRNGGAPLSIALTIAAKHWFNPRFEISGKPTDLLALLALILPKVGKSPRHQFVFIAIGMFGASLLYGDGVITPAISVLSAIEGVSIVAPALSDWVLPLTVGVPLMRPAASMVSPAGKLVLGVAKVGVVPSSSLAVTVVL